MNISVINHSKRALKDEEILRAIRAVNRQIEQDFAPYWSMSATLRLEGRASDRPDHQNPVEMRGDAVLYIRDTADEAEEALGFHDMNHRGVPYGFVFLDIARALREEWSVTLSHEALEMIADPDCNLLAAGPHPEDPSRPRVFHWYEVCDAVQDESYEIDGVAVSNFLLPLYFTEEAEPGSRNDFLGREYAGRTIRSFGVNPGGYVGFFDPEKNAADVFPKGDRRSMERRDIKFRAGEARRAIRRVPEGPARAALVAAVAAAPAAAAPAAAGRDRCQEFECFVFELGAGPKGKAGERAAAAVKRRLGEAYRVAPFAEGSGKFEARPLTRLADAGKAWELAAALAGDHDVAKAEPGFSVWVCDTEEPQGTQPPRPALRASLGGGDGHLPAAQANPRWSLEDIHASEAWDLIRQKGREPGEGVIIGHPDTGYTKHPELWPNAGDTPLLVELGFDFVKGDWDAADELERGGFLPQPGHGTRTGSVIVSAEGPPPGQAGETAVTGVAPAAKLVPFRVSRSVVLWSMGNLSKAIYRAVDKGCHVISISMGGWGLFNGTLHDAVRHARNRGVIVLAAAGNEVGFVVHPAKYDEVIAVAASNVARKPWRGSSHGDAVDVTAPGESVWRADTKKEDDGGLTFDVWMGRGTSFAVATSAGVAALWLCYHGRDALASQYGGPAAIPDLFQWVLANGGCDVPSGWDTTEYGPGIINARKVLEMQLPAPGALTRVHRGRRIAAGRRRAPATPVPESEIAHFFPGVDRRRLRAHLEDLLQVPAKALDARVAEVGPELAFQFATDPGLRSAFERRPGTARAPRGRRRAALLAAGAEDLRSRLLRNGVSSRLAALVRER